MLFHLCILEIRFPLFKPWNEPPPASHPRAMGWLLLVGTNFKKYFPNTLPQALVASTAAIEPFTLGDLEKYRDASVYDSLDTDVSVSRPSGILARDTYMSKPAPVMAPWYTSDLTRRLKEQQKLRTQRCRNFMGREVPCSTPPHLVTSIDDN